MKRLTVALLVVASACSSPRRDDDYPETYQPHWQVRDHGRIDVEIPDSGKLQYAAMCEVSQTFLSGWSNSLGDAQSTASSHRSETEWHRTSILWRKAGPTQAHPNFELTNDGAHEDAHDDVPIHPRR